jgi:hypothetical protein
MTVLIAPRSRLGNARKGGETEQLIRPLRSGLSRPAERGRFAGCQPPRLPRSGWQVWRGKSVSRPTPVIDRTRIAARKRSFETGWQRRFHTQEIRTVPACVLGRIYLGSALPERRRHARSVADADSHAKHGSAQTGDSEKQINLTSNKNTFSRSSRFLLVALNLT